MMWISMAHTSKFLALSTEEFLVLKILKKLRLNEKQPISCYAHSVKTCNLDHLKEL